MKIILSIFPILFIFLDFSFARQNFPADWKVLSSPSTCGCFALFESKNYIPELEKHHWYGGITRGWTCDYICIAQDGKEEKVRGTQVGGFTFTEKGDEFSCKGSEYEMVETPMRTDRWFFLNLVGVKSFSAHKSKVPELEKWSQMQNCK